MFSDGTTQRTRVVIVAKDKDNTEDEKKNEYQISKKEYPIRSLTNKTLANPFSFL